ncbi:hypothetical protein KTW01_002067 [Listeria monocytogenes]|nr:hypothetical protein [Listeria monocytogenes]EIA7097357.1 hypothetical protein [Listeria monocytogenes]
MTKAHELKIAPEDERNLDRKTTEELGFDMSHLDPSSKPKSNVPIVLDFDTTKLGVSK